MPDDSLLYLLCCHGCPLLEDVSIRTFEGGHGWTCLDRHARYRVRSNYSVQHSHVCAARRCVAPTFFRHLAVCSSRCLDACCGGTCLFFCLRSWLRLRRPRFSPSCARTLVTRNHCAPYFTCAHCTWDTLRRVLHCSERLVPWCVPLTCACLLITLLDVAPHAWSRLMLTGHSSCREKDWRCRTRGTRGARHAN